MANKNCKIFKVKSYKKQFENVKVAGDGFCLYNSL